MCWGCHDKIAHPQKLEGQTSVFLQLQRLDIQDHSLLGVDSPKDLLTCRQRLSLGLTCPSPVCTHSWGFFLCSVSFSYMDESHTRLGHNLRPPFIYLFRNCLQIQSHSESLQVRASTHLLGGTQSSPSEFIKVFPISRLHAYLHFILKVYGIKFYIKCHLEFILICGTNLTEK